MSAKTIDGTVTITGPDGASTGPLPLGTMENAAKIIADGLGKTPEEFALEPSEPGIVPERVIDELVHFRTVAKDHAQAFSDAIAEQAKKYKIKPGALKRFVCALEGDKLDELNAETDDLGRLIGFE